MISNGGTATLGLYDFKKQLDSFGGVAYFQAGTSYLPNARVMLANGDIVKNNTNGNLTNNPNSDMTGWFNESDEFVSVENFGVKFNTTADQSTAMQAALDSGKNLIFQKNGTIYANNLTQTTNNQVLIAFGSVAIQKNANGTIISSSANYPQIHNIKFRGGSSNTPEYTGDNLVFTGTNPKFINCGSMWAAGRALKCTGNAVVIRGSQDIWQTSDTTSTGYDIEIGVSGTATLYHQLDGIYTSQHTGGILLVDTGSHSLRGGQIGKLTIKAGTRPSGVNGGMNVGCRITGDVLVEQSSASFSSNQFSDINFTFGSGTSFCIVDSSNAYSNLFASTNNGNGANNIIIQNVGTGSDGFAYMKYGVGTNTRQLGMSFTDATRAWKFDGSIIIPNNQSLKMLDNAGTERIVGILSSANNLTLGANIGTYTYFQGNNIGLNSAAGTQVRVSDGFIAPFTDNSKTNGTASLRWSNTYAVNAHFYPPQANNPTANGEVVLELTSNTQLKFKAQGSDGVIRTGTITLA